MSLDEERLQAAVNEVLKIADARISRAQAREYAIKAIETYQKENTNVESVPEPRS